MEEAHGQLHSPTNQALSVTEGVLSTHSNLALNSDLQLLVQPDLNRGVLLKKLEDEMDWQEEDLAPSTAAATAHVERVS